MLGIAKKYLKLELSVLSADKADKRPTVGGWKEYQHRLPTESEVDAWFSNAQTGLCVIAGKVSGNLEVIDFDNSGELFDAWKEQLPDELFEKLVIARTPSGGYHAVYRCADQVCGNIKLAQRKTDKLQTLIETRGEGGLFLCAPTDGYEFIGTGFEGLFVVSGDERRTLLEAAWGLNEYIPEPVSGAGTVHCDQLRPGDDYNLRGDVREILTAHGWQYVNTAGLNGHWRRPGKNKGWSATLRKTDNVLYVFSSNAEPFDSQKAYSAFGVFAMLECGGDYRAASKKLSKLGFGEKPVDVDLSGILGSDEPVEECVADPGYLPVELMRIPGFVSELMDFCMDTAPYPNQGLAFCGALAMQSFLCGRKIRDAGNLRTNLYLLALAGSSSGKDWPRQINAHLMMLLGKMDCLGDKFASGEGIQDAMAITPNMLFQNDEIDGLLIAINKSKDGRLESVMSTLLTMYTSSGSVYALRRKAGGTKVTGQDGIARGFIDQPHLTLLGTATPKYYYESLSERMLSNGLFARMIVIDIGSRGKGQEAGLIDLMPERIIETGKYWMDFNKPDSGRNFSNIHPGSPKIIHATDKAKNILYDYRRAADAEYSKAESQNDEAAKAIWGRANENARKLALLYAASENPQSPEITQQSARWAVRLIDHQIRRMLFLTSAHVAENEFDGLCKRILNKIRNSPDRQIQHSKLLKFSHIKAKDFKNLIETLEECNEIEKIPMENVTKNGFVYKLR